MVVHSVGAMAASLVAQLVGYLAVQWVVQTAYTKVAKMVDWRVLSWAELMVELMAIGLAVVSADM